MRIFGLWVSGLDIFLLIVIFILIACLAMVFVTVFEGDPQKVKTFIQQQTNQSDAPGGTVGVTQAQPMNNVQAMQPQPQPAAPVATSPAPIPSTASATSTASSAKFCAYCGSPLREGDSFCTSCGNPVKGA